MSTISRTISHGIKLHSSGRYASPLTITATGEIYNSSTNSAIYGSSSQDWTIVNQGSVISTATAGLGGFPIFLRSGGDVVNGGLIEGYDGIYFGAAGGTVTNDGTVLSTGSLGAGIDLTPNYGATAVAINSGSIEAAGVGVEIYAPRQIIINGHIVARGSGSISNSGAISGDTAGIYLYGPGAISNTGSIGSSGIGIKTGDHYSVSISNSGIINGAADGIGGYEGNITNTSTIIGGTVGVDVGFNLRNFGTIEGGTHGVVAGGHLVRNRGTIEGGIYGLGVIVNGARGETTALVTDGNTAVDLTIGHAVRNFGTIESTGTEAGDPTEIAILLRKEGLLFNAGSITANAGVGVSFAVNGQIDNAGLVTGYVGIESSGDGVSILNAGTIEGSSGVAISMSGAGTVAVDPGALFIGNVIGAAGGTLELAQGYEPGSLSGLGTSFQSFGTIRIDPNAIWTLSGDGSGANIDNNGTLLVDGGATLTLGAAGEDAGQHGRIVLSSGGTAELSASVDAGQSFVFSDATGLLKLDDPGAFAATITGFREGDAIDLVNTAATSVTFSKSKHELAISNSGTPVATLVILGDYKTSDFALSSDGSGGTDITTDVVAPAAAPVVARSTRHATEAHDGRHSFAPFGKATGVAAAGGSSYAAMPLPWAGDPFHFWTIKG